MHDGAEKSAPDAPSLSVVVPISLRARQPALLERLLRVLETDFGPNSEIVVAHEDLNTRHDRALVRQVERAGARYVRSDAHPVLSISALRNRGAAEAQGSQLLFFDVDLVPPQGFRSLLESEAQKAGYQVAGSPTALQSPRSGLVIVPCLYATEAGTRVLEKQGPEALLEAFYAQRRDLVAFVALNTSTVLVSARAFASEGGFDGRFLNHGLEDFDLLLRLVLRARALPLPLDLLLDKPSQCPAEAVGFRALLQHLSLPSFLRGLYTVHAFHPRPLSSPYYGHREQNRVLFEANLREQAARFAPAPGVGGPQQLASNGNFDARSDTERMVALFGEPGRDHAALFDNRPQHLFQEGRTLRKLKKWLRMRARLFNRKVVQQAP